MGGRRVSIRDVAREAGVSVTTVSHALNDKGRLHPSTRARVREVAQRLGYRPNPAARSLVSGRTGLIALVATFPSGVQRQIADLGYFADLIGGATAVAVAHDVSLVVAPETPARREDERFVWDRIPLDGVIVVGPMEGDDLLPALRDRGIPFVTIGRDPSKGDEPVDAVVEADDGAAIFTILDHLRAAGAERPALISLPPIHAATADVVAGYERWCDEHGSPVLHETVGFPELLEDREATVAAAVDALLDRGADAIHCPVEQLGMAALTALRRRGRDVPGDVLLSTTNDAGRASTAAVPVTTVETDHGELGRAAAELLCEMLVGGAAPRHVRIPTRMEVRASTSPGAAGGAP